MDPDPEAAPGAAFPTPLQKFVTITVFTSSIIFFPVSSVVSPSIAEDGKQSVLDVEVKYTVKKKEKKKIIYLTFDDGPNKGTRHVMQIAEAEDIPITMFLVGQHVFGTEEQAEIFDSLKTCKQVELANHSYSHAHLHYEAFYSEPDSVVDDFKRCADSLQFNSRICRTPGRNIWRTDSINITDIKKTAPAADSLKSKNFILIGWDLEWHFDGASLKLKESADSISSLISTAFLSNKSRTAGHLVLLAHDQAYADATDSSGLHSLLKSLKNNKDYDFRFISEYPGIKQ